MEKIYRENGYVYLRQENDVDGRFPTIYNLGKDSDDPRWKEEEENPKPKKRKRKKSED